MSPKKSVLKVTSNEDEQENQPRSSRRSLIPTSYQKSQINAKKNISEKKLKDKSQLILKEQNKKAKIELNLAFLNKSPLNDQAAIKKT